MSSRASPSTGSRSLHLFAAAALLLGAGLTCKKGSGNLLGILSNGTACQSNSECQSGSCAEAQGQSVGFCTIVCQDNSDCTGNGFPKGCCIQPGDNSATNICALAILCSQGDAGLGEPCPNHDECAPGLTCLFDSNNVITECSVSCRSQSDCEGVAQECCEGITSNEEFCVIDNMCSATTGSGSSSGSSTSGSSGIIVADAGPVSVRLLVDGAEIDYEGGYEASVLLDGDVVVAPLPGRYAQLQFPFNFEPGLYSCSDGGGSLFPDGGPTVLGAFTTQISGSAGPFGENLPYGWFGLILPLQCGSGLVVGNPADVMEAAQLDITSFHGGSPTQADGGSETGHVTGKATWVARDTDAGSTLEVIEAFDVDLEPAG